MSSAFAASGPDMDELEDDLEMGQQARRGADRDQVCIVHCLSLGFVVPL